MTFICAECVGEPFLSDLIRDATVSGTPCEYCENEEAADLWVVARLCNDVLETFFEDSSQTTAVVHFGRKPAGEDLQTTIANLTMLPHDAVETVAEYIMSMWQDGEYGDEDPWFVPKSSMAGPLSTAWLDMEQSLHAGTRYFNQQAKSLLDTVFGNISNDLSTSGQPVVATVGPGTALTAIYRGRVFQTESSLTDALRRPEKLLGSPAAGVGSAGRMTELANRRFMVRQLQKSASQKFARQLGVESLSLNSG